MTTINQGLPDFVQEAFNAPRAADKVNIVGKGMGSDLSAIKATIGLLGSQIKGHALIIGAMLLYIQKKRMYLRLARRSALDVAVKNFELNERTARNWMNGAANVLLVVDSFPDLNQSQALALGEIDAKTDEERREKALDVLRKVQESGGPITAKAISEAISGGKKSSGKKDSFEVFLHSALTGKENAEERIKKEKDAEKVKALKVYAQACENLLEKLAV